MGQQRAIRARGQTNITAPQNAPQAGFALARGLTLIRRLPCCGTHHSAHNLPIRAAGQPAEAARARPESAFLSPQQPAHEPHSAPGPGRAVAPGSPRIRWCYPWNPRDPIATRFPGVTPGGRSIPLRRNSEGKQSPRDCYPRRPLDPSRIGRNDRLSARKNSLLFVCYSTIS